MLIGPNGPNPNGNVLNVINYAKISSQFISNISGYTHPISRYTHPLLAQMEGALAQIESVDTARNLGLIMTRDLKWNTHISNKCSLALKKWYNIARTTEITDLEALTLL